MREPEHSVRIETITRVCDAISSGDLESARARARTEWPFKPVTKAQRKMSPGELMTLWARDGFIDRYSGERLVFPGALRLLACLMPEELPYHKNGRADRCHFMHWQLYPSHDHIVPLARGGLDDPDNIVTTSMLRNQIKANWLLNEIGWELHAPGQPGVWNGLTRWFMREYNKRAALLEAEASLRRWRYVAANFFN